MGFGEIIDERAEVDGRKIFAGLAGFDLGDAQDGGEQRQQFVDPAGGVLDHRNGGRADFAKRLFEPRFCRILGTLLKNGVPILQSLRIAKDATGNRVLTDAIATAADSVSSGKSLAAPLAVSKQFPAEVIEMISVGEEANNLEHVLINVADTMERRTHRLLELAVRLLEPLMLIVMAAMILFVVIGLLLPVMKSSGTM